jgi:hypothetical protein
MQESFFKYLISITLALHSHLMPTMQKAVVAKLDDILGYSGQSDGHDAENGGESK